MTKDNMQVLDVLIASPGDAMAGRDVVDEAIRYWNDHRSDREGILFRVRRWETGSVPVLGKGDAQSVINSQLVDKSDIVFALFYHKLGSATERAISGTAEEIDRSVESGKLVHVYFYGGPRPNDVDIKQLKALNKFRKLLFNQGLIGSFSDEGQLAKFVGAALEHDIAEIARRENGDGATGPPEQQASAGGLAEEGVPPSLPTTTIDDRREKSSGTFLQRNFPPFLHHRRGRIAANIASALILTSILGYFFWPFTPDAGSAPTTGVGSSGQQLHSGSSTAFKSSSVRHSGAITLNARGVDLDSPQDDPSWGADIAGSKNDIQYADTQIRALGDAVLSIPDALSVSYADCRDEVYGSQKIATIDSSSVNDNICVRTNEGRYAVLSVTSTPSAYSDPRFNVTVWES